MSDPSTALSTGEWLLRFMLIPAAIIAIIWFLWALPGWLKRGSIRPGQPWVGEPLWVSGPDGTAGGPAAITAGSSTASALPSVPGGDPVLDLRGGASARW